MGRQAPAGQARRACAQADSVFLTEDDYPPFNFTGASGQLEGFNVDMARAVCAALSVPCLIQSRRWDTIVAALEAGQGDVIAASLAPTAEARARLLFTEPYYRMPARFVARRGGPLAEVTPQALKDKPVAVVAGTSHEAFLARLFPGAKAVAKPNEEAALDSLRKGEVEAAFGDGTALAFGSMVPHPTIAAASVGGPSWKAASSAKASAWRFGHPTRSSRRRSISPCSACGGAGTYCRPRQAMVSRQPLWRGRIGGIHRNAAPSVTRKLTSLPKLGKTPVSIRGLLRGSRRVL